jgi:acetylglutamate kinase
MAKTIVIITLKLHTLDKKFKNNYKGEFEEFNNNELHIINNNNKIFVVAPVAVDKEKTTNILKTLLTKMLSLSFVEVGRT